MLSFSSIIAIIRQGFQGVPSVFLLSLFLADILLLMTVAVSFLGKALIAIPTHEGPKAAMHADVIHHVAQFREGVATGGAHQELIGTAGVSVLCEQFDVSLVSVIIITVYFVIIRLLRQIGSVEILRVVGETVDSLLHWLLCFLNILVSLDEGNDVVAGVGLGWSRLD